MQHIITWWDALELFLQVLYCIAIPSSLIIIIQAIMLTLGFGAAESDINMSDTSGFDVDIDVDVGDIGDISDTSSDISGELGVFSLFTMQGIFSFLCVFSWVGIITYSMGLGKFLSLLAAFTLGLGAMIGVAKIIQLTSKLAHNGTLNMNTLIGERGTVYLMIPPKNEGQGKVMVQLYERLVECDAISESGERIPNNTPVLVTDILAGNILVVEKIDQ